MLESAASRRAAGSHNCLEVVPDRGCALEGYSFVKLAEDGAELRTEEPEQAREQAVRPERRNPRGFSTESLRRGEES